MVCGGGKGVRSKQYGRGHGFLRVMSSYGYQSAFSTTEQYSKVQCKIIPGKLLFYQELEEPRAIIRACLLIEVSAQKV